MSSKVARRRNRKKARQASQGVLAAHVPEKRRKATTAAAGEARGQAVRPTSERIARGVWAEPVGAVKSQQPIVDMAHDMVGRLHCDRKITDAQEQAARSYQETCAAYLAEMPDIGGYKSCLSGGTGGHDESDGDPTVFAAMRGIERRVGIIGSAELYRVCISGDRPRNIQILRGALDAVQC